MSNFRAHFLVPLNEITRIKVEILSCTLSSNTLMTHHVWILAQFGSWGGGGTTIYQQIMFLVSFQYSIIYLSVISFPLVYSSSGSNQFS